MKCDKCTNKAQFTFTMGQDYTGALCAACAANMCLEYGDAGGAAYFMSKAAN